MSTNQMNFGVALEYLRSGNKVSREGWNGKGLFVELQVPDEHSKMTLPYMYLTYPDNAKINKNARVPWSPTQTDILATDWVLVE